MATEEQKARQREYQRQYRRRQREREAAAIAVKPGHEREIGEMERAVEGALAAMGWIRDSDSAAVQLTRSAAQRIDALNALGTVTASMNALRWHAQLRALLQLLGGTPHARLQLELRSARRTAAATEEQVDAAPNVTRFKRPARRKGQD